MNLNFINFSLLDLLDIFLVAILLYYVYKLLKGSVAVNIVIGIAFIFLIWKITQALQMEMLSGILGYLLSGGVIAFIIVFQEEIRKFLLMIGTTNFSFKNGFFKQLQFLQPETSIETDIETIVNTCKKLSKEKTGALIVIECTNNLNFIAKSGDHIYAKVNEALLKSIFFKNSPLHDGAIIIRDNIIVATRAVLPVSNNPKIPARFGLRHKAALGITEKTDALAVIVSEETGEISYAKNGEFILHTKKQELISKLQEHLAN